MSEPLCPRGSEWRRWDLQVHTPFSALNNGFGQDFNHYAKTVFETAVENKIAVIGVTDYFCIDGYKRLLALRDDAVSLTDLIGEDHADAARRILLVPNIELRTSVIVTRPGHSDSRVNFHVLFSEKVDPDTIGEHFLRELKFTAEANPDHVDERWSLTSQNLKALGSRLKTEHKEFQKLSDLYVGMSNAVVSHEEVTKTLERQASRFQDKFLLLTPVDEDLSECSWDGQAHLTRKLFIQKSHMLLSANGNTRLFGLGLKHASVHDFIKEFKTLKPCVHGSDAHSYDTLFEPAERRYLWIKADPTFEGLKQVLHEPEDRVFIGSLPTSLQRASSRPTKVVDSVEITKTPGAGILEEWFNCSLPLNAELVAIIGNKGNGKSALADVLGLLGNTPRHQSFGFLKADRFRDPKNNKARHFQASLRWADGSSEGPVSLAADPDAEAVEKVRYVAQNYLEEICNEVGLGKDSRFQAELQQVIFSHVEDSERLGFETLDQLLEHKSEEVSKGIDILVGELTEINASIVAQEERLTAKHRKTLDLQLAEKRRESDAHDQAKPAPVVKPEDDPGSKQQSQQTTADIEAKRQSLRELEASIRELKAQDGRLARRKSAAERLSTKLKNLQRQVEVSLSEAAADLSEVGLTRDQIVTFQVVSAPIDEVIHQVDVERAALTAELDPDRPDSRESRRAATEKGIENLQESLSAPHRLYQEYLQQLKEWEAARGDILGSAHQPGTIRFLEQAIRDLDGAPKELRALAKARDRKALEILREKQRLRKYYEDYYGSVQEFLSSHHLAASDTFKVTFTVTIVQSGFAESFLGQINQRKLGYFAGVEEGAAALKRLTDSTDWNSGRSTIRFARQVVARLKNDGGNKRDVHEQLMQGRTVQALYDFIFSFGYLSPIYKLTWDGKGLEQLSPGERGNLLLIFYLLVARDDIPLVIDQPEENLDNQTVVRTLVPCIKDAKKRRQIVMVTHNPNLAVVCDAEQVIYAEIHKERLNEVSYVGGSIEDPVINQRIVDVLEGTRPAFDKRDARYQP